jgi:hypothetical protein
MRVLSGKDLYEAAWRATMPMPAPLYGGHLQTFGAAQRLRALGRFSFRVLAGWPDRCEFGSAGDQSFQKPLNRSLDKAA